jgi:molybdopterin molybdotransferase
MAKGTFLGALQLGLIASAGFGHVAVFSKPRVAFASTGDELCHEGHPLARGQIYDSNRLTLKALLIELGMEPIDLGVIPDDPAKIRDCLLEAAGVADIVLTSGGASVGDADFISSMLRNYGEVNFWKVAMKPGKPFLFGRLGNAHFMGLPGNPVSMMLTFLQLVRPGLIKLSGRMAFESLRLRAVLQGKLPGSAERMIFVRGFAHYHVGEIMVEPLIHQGSHHITSITEANVLILVPPHMAAQATGSRVQIELLPHAQIGSSPKQWKRHP